MLPSAITLRNYRSFWCEHVFALRPVTLLYGGNNAGKSALLRLLPLMADAVQPSTTGALQLGSQAAYGGGFTDLLWKGEDTVECDPDLGFGLVWDDDAEVRQADFTFVRVQRQVRIRECIITMRDEQVHRLQWVPERHEDSAVATYDYSTDEHSVARQKERYIIGFRGLSPVQCPPELEPLLHPLKSQLDEFAGGVQWLEAKRQAPSRKLMIPAGPAWRMATDGGDAAQLLYASPALRERVSGWYREAIGRKLEFIEAPPDEFRTVLRNVQRYQAVDVDLLDCGQGILQVLPVLAALALIQEAKGPRILAIEEPESHLHGNAQIQLVQELCRVAGQVQRASIAIETHSRHVLLGVQRALLQGGLQPRDIAIYWVRQDERGCSHIDRVTLDEDAFLQGVWPDPFTHDRDAARRVLEARHARNKR